jgi:transcriptional regulator with XRE-family HTH domain
MSEDIRKAIGRRIHEARDRLGFTQQDLATKLGKTQNSIASYESGTRTIRVTELPALSEALGVPIAYFFGENFADQEIAALVNQLTPPFRAGILINLRQQLQLQEVLLQAVGTIAEITPEGLELAGKMVEATKDNQEQIMRDEFTRIMMERVFGKTEDKKD